MKRLKIIGGLLSLSVLLLFTPVNAYAEIEGDGYGTIGGQSQEQTSAPNSVPTPTPVPESKPITKKSTKKQTKKVEYETYEFFQQNDDTEEIVVTLSFDEKDAFESSTLIFTYEDKEEEYKLSDFIKENDVAVPELYTDGQMRAYLTELVLNGDLPSDVAMQMYTSNEYTDQVLAGFAQKTGIEDEQLISYINAIAENKNKKNYVSIISAYENGKLLIGNEEITEKNTISFKIEHMTLKAISVRYIKGDGCSGIITPIDPFPFLITDPVNANPLPVSAYAGLSQTTASASVIVENDLQKQEQETISDNTVSNNVDQPISLSDNQKYMILGGSYLFTGIIFAIVFFIIYKKKKGE